MQTIEPTEHLRRKLALLDKRSVRRWPRWENDDYIAVAFLLDDVAARIEELERQLAVMWGEDEPHESRSECLSCEHLATQEAWPYCRSCLLTAQLEVCDDGFGDAVKRVKELERKLDMIEYTSLAQRIAIEELEIKVEVQAR